MDEEERTLRTIMDNRSIPMETKGHIVLNKQFRAW